jgi:glycosyltransferase involved in cell wall biosynthesis
MQTESLPYPMRQKMDLLEYAGLSEKQECRVIYLGGNLAKRDSVARNSIVQEPYVLYPANSYPHKNHIRLIQAFIQFKEQNPGIVGKLMLSGKILSKRLASYLSDASTKAHVEHLGYITKDELNSFLQNALALFFPSLFEGFGIPVLEALQYGKPVFCSDLPVFKEIVGDAVNYFNPESIDEMVAAFSRIFKEKNVLFDKAKAENVLAMINWKNCARDTLDFLKKIAAK